MYIYRYRCCTEGESESIRVPMPPLYMIFSLLLLGWPFTGSVWEELMGYRW